MKPRKYNSDQVKMEVSLSMRKSKSGDLFYMVEFPLCELNYINFSDMSSALDFIKSNF